MEAIVWHGRRDLRWQEVPEARVPGVGEVRVRVAFAGICGTDLEEYLDGPIYIPVDAPHSLTGRQAPLILGHEFSGVVDVVGEGVSTLAVGDHVAGDCLIYCQHCPECRSGRFNLCANLGALGQMADGGLAEFVTGPAYSFVKVPDPVPLDHAALAEPLAVAVRGVSRTNLEPGDGVLVTGAGTIGLFVLQVAQRRGAGSVTVVEPHRGRRELAERLGASVAVPSLKELSASERFDCAVECTGRPDAQRGAIALIRPKGRVVLVGIPTESTCLDTLMMINGEKEIVGSLSHLALDDFAAGVALMSQGDVQVDPLISRRYPLREGVRALEALQHPEDDLVKILLVPGTGEPVQRIKGGENS